MSIVPTTIRSRSNSSLAAEGSDNVLQNAAVERIEELAQAIEHTAISTIRELPPEVIVICLDHLHVRELAQAAGVSRSFKSQAYQARPFHGISYSDIVLMQRALNRFDQRPLLALLARDGLVLQCAGEYRGDIDAALIAVRQNGLALEFFPAILCGFSHALDVPLSAVRQNYLALQFVGELPYSEDARVRSLAIRQNAAAFLLVSQEEQHNPRFIWEAIRWNRGVVEFVDESFKTPAFYEGLAQL